MWNWSESHLSNGWWDSNEFKWNIRINSIFELRASSGISFQGWFKQWSWVATVVPNQANLNHASEQFTYHQYHAKTYDITFLAAKTMNYAWIIQFSNCVGLHWLSVNEWHRSWLLCCSNGLLSSDFDLFEDNFWNKSQLARFAMSVTAIKEPKMHLKRGFSTILQFCNFAILQSHEKPLCISKKSSILQFIQLSDSSVAELQNANHGWETYTSGIKSSKKYLLMCRLHLFFIQWP